MQFKYIFIILVTVVLTVFFMQNSEPVDVMFLFTKMKVSKLALLPGLAIFGFLVGYVMGRTGKRRAEKQRDLKSGPNASDSETLPSKGRLSQQDEDYIR